MTDLEYLQQRLAELKQAEAQAIHSLGVVAGRLEEVELMIQRLKEAALAPTTEH